MTVLLMARFDPGERGDPHYLAKAMHFTKDETTDHNRCDRSGV